MLIETTDAQAADIGGSLSLVGRYIDASSSIVPFGYIWGRKENSTSNNQDGYLALGTRGSGIANERLRISSAGNIGIGTTSPTNLLSLGGNVARTFWMERHTIANTAGNPLTIQAGSATAGATDKNGGSLILTSGIATGTGSAGIEFQTSTAGATGTVDRTPATTLQISGAGQISEYANVATTGWGIPAIYATGRATARTNAVASVASYTVGGADGSFQVSANVNVTVSTAHNITVDVDYTDETNTARSLELSCRRLTGTVITSITDITGVGPYHGISLHLRCKAATTITVKTDGTFTTVTYNVEATITQIA
jgi:hypothetical protein